MINVTSAKLAGIDAVAVSVEVDVTAGLGIHLVGLADVAVKESLLRTITALQSVGFRIPGKKIVINLAPADMHKKGSGYDLPIAVGIVAASGQMHLPRLKDFLLMGELGLDGSLRAVAGTLSAAELARSLGKQGCIFPWESAPGAAVFDDLQVYGARSLTDVFRILDSPILADEFLVRDADGAGQRASSGGEEYLDFAEIFGQDTAKRGLEIAAAGGHNVIMIGAPGSGKTTLARALAGILPHMDKEEAMVVSKVYSAAGKNFSAGGLIRTRPFRSPHYSATLAAIIGGGTGDNILPGEVSLSHEGVLFLDEFAQMPKSVTEALRGPIEDRRVVISRLHSKIEFPSSFMLVAASNPCPCGYYGEGERCTCTPGQRLAYLSKLSGPIMDRIDIQLWVHPVKTGTLLDGYRMGAEAGGSLKWAVEASQTSAAIRERVIRAREVQRERFGGSTTNAEMSGRQMQMFCPLSADCESVLHKIIDSMSLSARAFSRIIKMSRTIADLEGVPDILPRHILEASSMRFLDRRNIL